MKAPGFSILRYGSTSTGKKFLMALSGAVLVLFIAAHLAGNLQVFEGQDAINRYAVFLRSLGELLWAVRIGLLAALVVHIWTSVALAAENRAARPQPYIGKRYIQATLASRTMILSGLLVLAFIVFHLLHFTFLKIHPEWAHGVDALGRRDVYSMMVRSFQDPYISAWYILCVFLLCYHLSHGLSSMFQSLGFNNERLRARLGVWAPRVAWLLFAGYAAIPLAVLAGVVKLPPGVRP